jgi:flagellar L-ring protein precursor FlgH
MKRIFQSFVFLILISFLSGCSSFGRSMKEFLGGETPVAKKKSQRVKRTVGKIDNKKRYRRTDHETLQEKSLLGAESGSLWIERGQGSYLFTQNTNRLIGDLVNVEIEGQAKKQIETKVNVIQNLIEKIKKQQEAKRLAAERRQTGRDPASKDKKAASASKKSGKKDKFEVKVVPSRITEILKDGSYMVQGDQPFMIGKREYKLVVKGIVRQEDFDDQGISAETLLDPKFDIVTNRRGK